MDEKRTKRLLRLPGAELDDYGEDICAPRFDRDKLCYIYDDMNEVELKYWKGKFRLYCYYHHWDYDMPGNCDKYIMVTRIPAAYGYAYKAIKDGEILDPRNQIYVCDAHKEQYRREEG